MTTKKTKKSVKKSIPKKQTKKQIKKNENKNLAHKIKKSVKTVKHKKGYFKKDFTKLTIKAVKIINPEFSKNKLLASRLGISQQTLNKVIKGNKVSSKTYKKITNVIGNLRADYQIKINLIVEDLKKGKKVNQKKIDKLVKNILKKQKKNLETVKPKLLYIYLSYE